ncbi:MAG TPA: hypothetical protein VIK18_22295 [Pirellulales bacterium]
MDPHLTDSRLEAYLDEALADDELAAIEQAVRRAPAAAARLAELRSQRDAGQNSLGAIWRRQRLTCPARSRLGSYLLGILPADEATQLRVHVEVVGCLYCRANLEDLRREHAGEDHERSGRRQKIFESSAGLLGRKKDR